MAINCRRKYLCFNIETSCAATNKIMEHFYFPLMMSEYIFIFCSQDCATANKNIYIKIRKINEVFYVPFATIYFAIIVFIALTKVLRAFNELESRKLFGTSC